jgi:hypothetical protein
MSNLIKFGNQYVDLERVKKYAERQLNRTVNAINEDYDRNFTGKFAYRAVPLKFTFFLYDENRDNIDKVSVVVQDGYDERRDIDTFDVYVTTSDYSQCVGDNLSSLNDRDLEIAIDVACSLIEQMDWSY